MKLRILKNIIARSESVARWKLKQTKRPLLVRSEQAPQSLPVGLRRGLSNDRFGKDPHNNQRDSLSSGKKQV
ncbi:MAG: hypothetical protein E3K32_03455 [wastewater metagenome]|nr:hypothetical protein [Candidatus Loosdrechtia aerotolerans]